MQCAKVPSWMKSTMQYTRIVNGQDAQSAIPWLDFLAQLVFSSIY